jgi:hypothetical protein
MLKEAGAHEVSRFSLPVRIDEKWAVVERICASAPFRRSAKLRDLLLYLCHRSWTEGATDIREHEIGVDVFRRPADYDSAQDTIVRVQASQLRKRLEKYFSEVGVDESLILEVPRGSYVPTLRPRHTDTDLEEELPAPLVAHRSYFKTACGLAVVCVVLAALIPWLALRQPAQEIEGEALRRFWSAFAPEGTETTVVIADSTFSAMQDMLRRPILLEEYVARTYRGELERAEHSPEKKEVLSYLMERRYTSLADVMVVQRLWLSSVLDPRRTSIIYARDFHLRNLQKGNHVLVGSRRAVPWVDLFDSSLDFHYVYDENTRYVHVVNRRPRDGEPEIFHLNDPTVTGTVERFSVVASLPNLSGQGNVLILSGQEMSGTEAAANLVTTDVLFREVLNRLPEQQGRIPYFEALLKVKHVEFTTQGFEILAVHPH